MIETVKHSHYFKSVKGLSYIDVYRVLKLFEVTDPCIAHAVKKLLVAGGRGAGKSITQDVQEAIDTLQRYLNMQNEDNPREPVQGVKKERTFVDPRFGSQQEQCAAVQYEAR